MATTPITAADISEEMIGKLLTAAIHDEDLDMLELCETTQKMIVRRETVDAARTEIARLLNARDDYDGPPDGDAWSGGFAENH